jgi:DNA-nicking Smr family endonuclease
MSDTMARQRNPDGKPPLNTPFRDLKKLVRPVAPVVPAKAAVATPPPVETPIDETELFRSAVAGAVPIPPDERNTVIATLPTAWPAPAGSEEAEALATLSDVVSGAGAFDISDGDEYLEGRVAGLDPRVVERLRRGEFAPQAHLDLHGLTAEGAQAAVRKFILRALRAGHRCVLLIHGRGRNSPDQRPVLKEGLRQWLTRGELARVVLAFSTARPCDGGAGAMYVLLRRERRPRKPFHVLAGAKS